MRWLRRSALAGVAAVVLAAAPAVAGEPASDDRARVAELVRAGRASAKANQWDACIASLSEALEFDDAPTTVGDLGLCEEQAGKVVAAWDHLRRALEAAPPSSKEEPWLSYRAASGRVLKRVGLVWVTVVPREARVLLDGRPLGRADGRSFAVEPGKHTFAARAEGYEDKLEAVSVRGGDVPHVNLVLEPKPATSLPVVPPSSSGAAIAAESGHGPRSVRGNAPVPWYQPAWSARGVLVTLSYVGLATAVTSGATALALEVDRGSMRGQVDSIDCGAMSPSRPAVCGPLGERRVQRDIAGGVALGALVAAGLLSGATLVAIVRERGATSPTVIPAASLNGGGVFVLGSW